MDNQQNMQMVGNMPQQMMEQNMQMNMMEQPMPNSLPPNDVFSARPKLVKNPKNKYRDPYREYM